MRLYNINGIERKMLRCTFNNRTTVASIGFNYELYCTNTMDVLVEQVANTLLDGIISINGERYVCSQPLYTIRIQRKIRIPRSGESNKEGFK